MEERLQSMAEMRQSTPVQSSSSGAPPTSTTAVPRVSSKSNTKVSISVCIIYPLVVLPAFMYTHDTHIVHI